MIFANSHHDFSIDIDGDGIADQIELANDTDSTPDDQTIWNNWSSTLAGDLDNSQLDNLDDIGTDDTLKIDDSVDFSPEIEPTESGIVGNINDAEHWHQQSYDDTCGIVAQEYILDDIGQAYGIDFSEDELRDTAAAAGWYTPDGGTPMMQVGNLLEAYGIGVEKSINASLDDIDRQLEAGHQVLVAVDADEIWNPNDMDDDDLIANLQGMPGQEPNHTVQVIGIDNSDSNNPMVILNDPGTPDGKGLTVPADDFLNAWSDSNNFMVATTDNITPNSNQFAFDNNSSQMDNILLGNVTEGDYQKSWGDSYQSDADNAKDWADRYAKDGNVDKTLEFEKQAAEAQEKADERYRDAQKAYQNK